MNTDARVKVGDYFYYGLGTDDIGLIDDDSQEDLDELIKTGKLLKKVLNNFENDEEDEVDLKKDTKKKEKDTKEGDNDSDTVTAAEGEEDEKTKKKKKTSIFDIVIYLKSKFYIGHGTVLYKKAVANYQVAADLYSSIAMWNLGWMYENGVGVETDLNLAKRHYDRALATNSEASVPVGLSLFKLNFKHMLLFLKGEVPSMYIDNKPRKTVIDRIKEEKKRLFDLYERFNNNNDLQNNQNQNQNNENGGAAGTANTAGAAAREQGQNQANDQGPGHDTGRGEHQGQGQGRGRGRDQELDDLAAQIEKLLLEEIGDLENLLEILSITVLAAIGAFLLWYRQIRFPQRNNRQRNNNNNNNNNNSNSNNSNNKLIK